MSELLKLTNSSRRKGRGRPNNRWRKTRGFNGDSCMGSSLVPSCHSKYKGVGNFYRVACERYDCRLREGCKFFDREVHLITGFRWEDEYGDLNKDGL